MRHLCYAIRNECFTVDFYCAQKTNKGSARSVRTPAPANQTLCGDDAGDVRASSCADFAHDERGHMTLRRRPRLCRSLLLIGSSTHTHTHRRTHTRRHTLKAIWRTKNTHTSERRTARRLSTPGVQSKWWSIHWEKLFASAWRPRVTWKAALSKYIRL